VKDFFKWLITSAVCIGLYFGFAWVFAVLDAPGHVAAPFLVTFYFMMIGVVFFVPARMLCNKLPDGKLKKFLLYEIN